jgi:hypothetical protein
LRPSGISAKYTNQPNAGTTSRQLDMAQINGAML